MAMEELLVQNVLHQLKAGRAIHVQIFATIQNTFVPSQLSVIIALEI